MVVVDSAGGVGAATVAVVSKPGPGLPGDDVGVTSLTDTLIGPKSFLEDSLKTPSRIPRLMSKLQPITKCLSATSTLLLVSLASFRSYPPG